MKKLVILFIAIAGFAGSSFGQGVSTTATASAFIVTPIAISKTLDMNFGNVAVNATAGTVVLPPSGPRTVTGGCTLPAAVGTVTAAHFVVTGTPTYTFSISITPALITVDQGANHMNVDTWVTNPTPTGTLAGGTATVDVGGTLHVTGGQATGAYTSATPFTITVNYN
jgi:hypothetical protein